MKRTPLRNGVASTSRSPSTDTTEANLIKQNTVGRRSLLKGLGMAGVAALPAGALLINQAKAREDTDENDDNGGRLSTGEASILRFLTPAEIPHRTRAICAAITLVTLQVTTAFAAQTYLIADLGTLPGGTTASAAAINNNNQVVGSSGLDAFLLSKLSAPGHTTAPSAHSCSLRQINLQCRPCQLTWRQVPVIPWWH